jgi:hypothetical protein
MGNFSALQLGEDLSGEDGHDVDKLVRLGDATSGGRCAYLLGAAGEIIP